MNTFIAFQYIFGTLHEFLCSPLTLATCGSSVTKKQNPILLHLCCTSPHLVYNWKGFFHICFTLFPIFPSSFSASACWNAVWFTGNPVGVMAHNFTTLQLQLGACSFGTILELEYKELTVFLGDLFWFWNEWNSILSILLPIAELME